MEWERAKKKGYLKDVAEAQKILDAFHAGEVTAIPGEQTTPLISTTCRFMSAGFS